MNVLLQIGSIYMYNNYEKAFSHPHPLPTQNNKIISLWLVEQKA